MLTHGLAVALLLGSSAAVARAEASETPPVIDSAEDVDEDDEGLRQRLTEREDKRRPLKPFSVEIGGHRLVLGGELELELLELQRWIVGEQIDEPDRRLLAPALELEAFYSLGKHLSFFAQIQLALEEDLLHESRDEVSAQWVERGEIWVASHDIAGSGLGLEIGRLDFEDDRRWWWDEELDAVRVIWEKETTELQVAFGREVWPNRSDVSFIDPEHDRVSRLIAEFSWDFHADHGIQLFALRAHDRSKTRPVGSVIDTDREDEPDSKLTWLGARSTGMLSLGRPGWLGYWIDTAAVHGREHWTEYEEISDTESEVASVTRRDVDGWAFDVGASWLPDLAPEPRIFAGYALASESFRQTSLHANEAGFGGVERFGQYGFLLQPELSNLQVLTAGVGCSLLRSSSLDLVYHEFRLHQKADELWNAELQLELTGDSRKLGREVDLVLVLEEWERLELELALAAFQAGPALGDDQGRWSYGSFLAIRYAF